MALPSNYLVYYAAVSGFSYTDTKIGKSDGTETATGAGVVIDLTGLNYNDMRLVSFATSSASYLDACNRTGPAGQPGAGQHFVMQVPIPSALPSETKSLQLVANPYSAVVFNNFLYINDYDNPVIYAATIGGNFALRNNGDPVYEFDNSPRDIKAGVDLEVVGNNIYALFSLTDDYSTYDPSQIVRLTQDTGAADPAVLYVATPADDYFYVGMNATGMAVVNYKPQGEASARDFFLVSCIGGSQSATGGNGALSMLSVVDIYNNAVLPGHIDGTYASGTPAVALDIKAVAASRPSTKENPLEGEIAYGDSYIYIMAASYNKNWNTNFIVGQTKASVAIEHALSSTIDNMGICTQVDFGEDLLGYFWTVAFCPDTGSTGTLVAGRGSASAGDQLSFFTVNLSGASTPGFDVDSDVLYGQTGCLINTMTVATLIPSPKTRVLRSIPPQPVLTKTISMTDFLAERRKKEEKK